MGTMRRHSLLDILTLWGGISMFMLVVLYIVGKRSLYFVPGFAKNFVTAPFRARWDPPPLFNSTSSEATTCNPCLRAHLPNLSLSKIPPIALQMRPCPVKLLILLFTPPLVTAFLSTPICERRSVLSSSRL